MWCVAPLEMKEGNSLGGRGTIGLQTAVPKRPHTRRFYKCHLEDTLLVAQLDEELRYRP